MYDILALPGPNNTSSLALGLSPEGDVAGWAAEPEAGVIWRDGHLAFSLPAKSGSKLLAVNSSGDAVGVLGESDPTPLPVLVRDGVAQDLSPMLGKGSNVTDINDAGQVCGNSSNNNKGFVYDSHKNEVIQWIEPLPNMVVVAAEGINEHGAVAVQNFTGQAYQMVKGRSSFYDHDSGLKDLGLWSSALGLNDSGIVCGGLEYLPSPYIGPPATWDANEQSPAAKDLPLPEGFDYGEANGINNYGDVVGWCEPDRSAFIYSHSDQITTDLNKLISDPKWHLIEARGINDKGQIVGYGTFEGVGVTAFLLNPPKGPVMTLTLPDDIDIALPVSFEQAVGTVLVGGRGWVISLKGAHTPRPAPPPPLAWMRLDAAKREALMGLVLDELATYIEDVTTRTRVRTELLEEVRGTLDRQLQSLAETPTPPVGEVVHPSVTPELQARIDRIIARPLRMPQSFGRSAPPR
jgi:uncharacterized membrane protein